jgi:flagellar motor switch protein FliN/FliY
MADENLELNELDDESPPEKTDDDQAIDVDNLPGIDNLPKSARDLEAVYDIPVQVSAVLGKSTMQVSQLLKLGRGAVIELDRKVGEAIDIYVNNRLVARGEVVVVEDRLGVTMTEIIKTERAA